MRTASQVRLYGREPDPWKNLLGSGKIYSQANGNGKAANKAALFQSRKLENGTDALI